MIVPEGMPVLGRGGHDSAAQGACVMEYVSLLAGEPWSDTPVCTDRHLARAAQVVNDALPDDRRHVLLPFVTRLMGTAQDVDPSLPPIDLALALKWNHVVQQRGSNIATHAMRLSNVEAERRSRGYLAAFDLVSFAETVSGSRHRSLMYANLTDEDLEVMTDANVDGIVRELKGLLDDFDRIFERTSTSEATPETYAQMLDLVSAAAASVR